MASDLMAHLMNYLSSDSEFQSCGTSSSSPLVLPESESPSLHIGHDLPHRTAQSR